MKSLEDQVGPLESADESFSKEMTAFDEVFYASTNQKKRVNESLNFALDQPFNHEPATNFQIDENQAWIENIMARWQSANIEPIPLQIGADFLFSSQSGMGEDPSRPDLCVAYRFAISQMEHVELALETGADAAGRFSQTALKERQALLVEAAKQLARQRGSLIGASMLDGGKTIEQADAEVSNAIDIANYYARSASVLERSAGSARFEPFGLTVVVPPRNMPLDVVCGNILAVLLAGNGVILKPSFETVLIAWELAKTLWDAGVPKPLLQFVPTRDDETGRRLVTDRRVAAVVLTGSYDTARQFLAWKPEMRLIAETGGKNSMIVAPSADYEMAIKDIIYSAFGHNGLKSSASGMAILVKEVYDDPEFMAQLKEAAEALAVGSAWEMQSLVTPLIRQPDEVLMKAQNELEPCESWLLEPQMVDGNPNLWSPGIKLGIQAGSFYHTHECFGPMLGLMRAEDLSHAIQLSNQSEFGLTASLHATNPREIEAALNQIEAGNLYINRNTTHTFVQRQPFGGWKKSSFGISTKAGGPNYLLGFGKWVDPRVGEREVSTADKEMVLNQMDVVWETHFALTHTTDELLGERSLFRYRPIHSMLIRFDVFDASDQFMCDYLAQTAERVGVPVTFSLPETAALPSNFNQYRVVRERATDMLNRVSTYERIRYVGRPSQALWQAAHEAHVPLIDHQLTLDAYLELRYFLKEQTLSERMIYSSKIESNEEE
ncbi:MAG: aldehyde dehydrogenase family protein [Chloroflexota bacterium]